MVTKKLLLALLLTTPVCVVAQQSKDSVSYAISLINGYKGRIDYSEGLRILKKYAVLGDVNALNGLGICYSRGIGIMKNEEASYSCFMEAAQQGCGKSWLNLGYMHSDKKSYFHNDSKAREYFLKAIENGCLSALYPAACSYYYNEPIDYTEAYKLFYEGALHFQPESMYMIGLCNMYGQGTTQNFSQAEEWLNSAKLYGIKDAAEKLTELDSLQSSLNGNVINLQIKSVTPRGEIMYSFNSQKDANYYIMISSSLHTDRHFEKTLSCQEGNNCNTVSIDFPSGVYTFCIVLDNIIESKTFYIK